MRSVWRMSLIVLFSVLPFSLFAKVLLADVTVLNFPDVLAVAKTLPQTGVLANDGDYIYLKISADYQNKLFPLLIKKLDANQSACLSPDHNRIGAHMTLIDDIDVDKKTLAALPIGQTFSFTPTQLRQVTLQRKYHGQLEKTVWYTLAVASPALTKLVTPYVPDGYLNQPFHVSLGVAKFDSDGECYH